MQENQSNQLIKEFLIENLLQDQLEKYRERLIDLVTEEILKSLPEAQANQLRSQIESGATPEEMQATIKSANLNMDQIVQGAVNRLTEEK